MSVIGLSPNDLADWIRLLVRVAAALKEEGGSKSRYQQASQTVDATIAAVDDLEDFAVSANNILSSDSDGLQRLAQDLRKPFEEAKGKLTKYQPSLGVQARPGKRRGIFQKINWTFSGEPEVKDHYEQATVGMEAAIIEAVMYWPILLILLCTGADRPKSCRQVGKGEKCRTWICPGQCNEGDQESYVC